jgi:hypothetical protein
MLRGRRAPAMRAALLLIALLLAGCAERPVARPPTGATEPPGHATDDVQGASPFDGASAFEYVRNQVESDVPGDCPARDPNPGGVSVCPMPHYRIPGTAGNNETAAWILAMMGAAPWQARFDDFTASREGHAFPAHNVVATRAGRTNATVMLVAHYDSRPCADEDPVPANRTQPVLGANDGGSGVAVLLELARVLPPRMNLTLRFVFDDAEDMGDSGHGCGANTAWAQGAVWDAQHLSPQQVRDTKALLLLDLVGDPGLRLPREGASALGSNRAVQDAVWSWGQRLGHAQFLDAPGPYIDDDHLPYIQRGIPSVDIIDLRDAANVFPPDHHTTFDDLEHVSAPSLQAVGDTVLAALRAWDAEAGGGLK